MTGRNTLVAGPQVTCSSAGLSSLCLLNSTLLIENSSDGKAVMKMYLVEHQYPMRFGPLIKWLCHVMAQEMLERQEQTNKKWHIHIMPCFPQYLQMWGFDSQLVLNSFSPFLEIMLQLLAPKNSKFDQTKEACWSIMLCYEPLCYGSWNFIVPMNMCGCLILHQSNISNLIFNFQIQKLRGQYFLLMFRMLNELFKLWIKPLIQLSSESRFLRKWRFPHLQIWD